MNVKNACEKIDKLRIMKRFITDYIDINKDTLDLNAWEFLNDIEIELSDFIHFLENVVDNTEIKFI